RYDGCTRRPCQRRFYFFFQAEDGIRDRNVTGVQTCALPISAYLFNLVIGYFREHELFLDTHCVVAPAVERVRGYALEVPYAGERSEERRVGKECRSRGSRTHSDKGEIEYMMRHAVD